jgi:hypothetical protein
MSDVYRRCQVLRLGSVDGRKIFMEHWCNDTDMGTLECRRKNLSVVTLFTKNETPWDLTRTVALQTTD